MNKHQAINFKIIFSLYPTSTIPQLTLNWQSGNLEILLFWDGNNIVYIQSFNLFNCHDMQAGRVRNNETRMKGTTNEQNKLTDIYLPRKCDYTDRVITSKDHASVQLNICDLNTDGTINHTKSTVVTISGFVRSTGQGDSALSKILQEKHLV